MSIHEQRVLRRNIGWNRFANRPGAKTFRLVPGALALALILKYVALVGYGLTASVLRVPSFVSVGGSLFALAWAVVIFVFASLALAATARTWYTGHFRLEKWAIAGLVLMFLAYSVVIVVRGALQNDWVGASVAWLPVILSILPTIRYYSLSARPPE